MNSDTERYALLMDAYAELQPEIEVAVQNKPISVMPALSEVLTAFGPMPEEALFLGVASDELPVLLNLFDPIPGPVLVIGDSGAGKTTFLHTIARAAARMHKPEKLQFGALTNHPDEWNGFEDIPNNVGVFSMHHGSSDDFILSLASWAHGNKTSKQSVLLLLDNLELVMNMDLETVQNLRWLLLRGPSRRVWPIITLSSQKLEEMGSWLALFRTRILGNMHNPKQINQFNARQANLESLMAGSEFALSEGDHWLRFWLPDLD